MPTFELDIGMGNCTGPVSATLFIYLRYHQKFSMLSVFLSGLVVLSLFGVCLGWLPASETDSDAIDECVVCVKRFSHNVSITEILKAGTPAIFPLANNWVSFTHF